MVAAFLPEFRAVEVRLRDAVEGEGGDAECEFEDEEGDDGFRGAPLAGDGGEEGGDFHGGGGGRRVTMSLSLER